MRKNENLSGSLMGDIAGTSDKVFEIYRRYAENDIFPWDDTGTNLLDNGNLADAIKLNTGSVYGKETAGSKNAGRSGTIQVGNMTETAFWTTTGRGDPALAYLQSLYDGDSISLVVADSTPNGPSGWFYNTWVQDNEWAKIFAAWFEFDDSRIPFESEEALQEFKDKMTDDEHSEIERFNPGWEQMHWRRRTLQDKCNGDLSKFRQEYPSDPEECFLMSSRPRFHVDIVKKMDDNAKSQKSEVGTVNLQNEGQTASFKPDERGFCEIWNHPHEDDKYVISVDTCTGEDQQQQGLAADPDYHSVQVWRAAYEDYHGEWHVSRLVALHHSRVDIGYLAEEIEALSTYYGKALVIPEVNNSGLAIVRYLIDRGVPCYRRRRINDSSGMVEKSFGWSTDKITRKTIIDHLASEIIEENVDVPSPQVLKEFKTFVINEKGKPEAAPGHHDDHVLSAAIALYNIDSASAYKGFKKKRISNDMLRKDPKLLCPDGFLRIPLNQYVNRQKKSSNYKRLQDIVN
jgi:hypothetical protein